jgi:hypothetical protein
MDLSNSAATLTTSAVAIAPSHHHRLRVRNVNIHARMPQPDGAPASEFKRKVTGRVGKRRDRFNLYGRGVLLPEIAT